MKEKESRGSETARLVEADRRGQGRGTYIALSDETGHEVEVIIEVKAAAEFEGAAETGDGGGLRRQLLHAPHPTELFVGLVLRN